MSYSLSWGRSSVSRDIPLLPLHEPRRPTQKASTSTPFYSMNSSSYQIPRSDALSNISRQEDDLKSTIQSLLDAQSEGLLAGLHGEQSADDASSTTNTLPSSHGRGGVVPVRQPTKRRIGLQGARKGISKAITDLAWLKSEEARALDEEVAQRGETLARIQSLETKSSGLQEKIKGIQSESTSQHLESLQQQSKNLEQEIYETETRLYEMKARQRHLLREVDGLSNSVQSKLSSYQSALTLAEKDARQFLGIGPSGSKALDGDFWSLPKERRTLSLARDHFKGERQVLEERLQAVQAEETALEEGGTVWEDAVLDVRNVEKTIQAAMQRMQSSPSNNMHEILTTIQNARSRLQSKLESAERQHWTLLVCCIGAELEALIQGQRILENASGLNRDLGLRGDDGESQKTNGNSLQNNPVNGNSISDTGPYNEQLPEPKYLDRSEDEDEGPGPELLISHHEDDQTQG